MVVGVDKVLQRPEVCSTKQKDAQSVAKFLCWEAISWWGLPDDIFTDNGRKFVDKIVNLILQKLGIRQCLGALPLALMACCSSELWENLSLLEEKMKVYVKYLTNLHGSIFTYVSDRQKQEEVLERLEKQKGDRGRPREKVFVKVFKRKRFNDHRRVKIERDYSLYNSIHSI